MPPPRIPPELAGEGTRPPSVTDPTTGLPASLTWPAVYTVVLGIFLLWIALLTWLTKAYS